jgi:hypothetical protein
MAKVLRYCAGGGVVVEASGLSIEKARSLASHMASVGEPAGCCWCVGLWEEDDVEVADESLVGKITLPRQDVLSAVR